MNRGKTRRLRNEGEYSREVKYGGLSWKERGVDSLAVWLAKSGNEHIYVYRFDWDEEGIIDGYDYSKALGAGHAVELPFVFGVFTTGWVQEEIYSNREKRHVLADNMMSYWTQFAITGDPGTGRNLDLPRWLSWGTNGKTTLVLDTPTDQGIYMLEGIVTPASFGPDGCEGLDPKEIRGF